VRFDIVDAAGELCGSCVWTFRDPDGVYQYRRGFLVEVVAPLGDRGRLAQIIRASCDATTPHAPDALLCHHMHPRLTNALRDVGFTLRQPERFLLVDPGPLAGEALSAVLAADNWFVTQGDSDIDRPW
jgi:hypothetical protein